MTTPRFFDGVDLDDAEAVEAASAAAAVWADAESAKNFANAPTPGKSYALAVMSEDRASELFAGLTQGQQDKITAYEAER